MCGGGGFFGKLGRSAMLPFDTIKASDPFTQFITGNKVDFNADHNLDHALAAGYKDDPIGGTLLTEDDYKRSGKIAAGAAAAFFGGGALAGSMGSGSGVATGGVLDTGSLTTADMALAPGVGGAGAATASTVGAGAADVAAMQGFGTSAADMEAAANGTLGLGSEAGAGGASGLSTFRNYGKLASGLYDMYASNKKDKALQGQADALANMYQPGTPEYDMWKQQLERRDAASGRRSQYGPRSVELAAAMAKQRSANLTSANYANAARGALDNRYGGLNTLFSNADSIYGAYKAAPKVYNDVSNWFSGTGTASNVGDAASTIGASDGLSYLF